MPPKTISKKLLCILLLSFLLSAPLFHKSMVASIPSGSCFHSTCTLSVGCTSTQGVCKEFDVPPNLNNVLGLQGDDDISIYLKFNYNGSSYRICEFDPSVVQHCLETHEHKCAESDGFYYFSNCPDPLGPFPVQPDKEDTCDISIP